jgi:hypothetical protein
LLNIIEKAIYLEKFLAKIFPVKEGLEEYYSQAKKLDASLNSKFGLYKKELYINIKREDISQEFFISEFANIPILEFAKASS